MNEIYEKINNHEYLENEDMVKIITFFSKGKVKTIFVNDLDTDVMFLYDRDSGSKILIKNDIKNECLQYSKGWLKYYDIEDKNTALVDLYNLYLLWSLFHELGHFIQSVHMTKFTTRIEIIKATIAIANLNETNYYGDYKNNGALYCYELDANLLATIKMYNIIKNKVPNLNHTSIRIYNRIIAGHLCAHYEKKTKKQEKLYPILYAKLLVKHYYNIFRRIHINICIERLEKKSTTEYRRLLNGFDLSNETIKIFHDVYAGFYKTDNILDEIKKIDKVKVR